MAGQHGGHDNWAQGVQRLHGELKTLKQSIKDKQSKKMPKEDWLVFENKHDPIVDADTWQAANDIRQKKRRNKPDSLGEPHPLTGLLYCADCKSKMHHSRGMNKDKGEPTGRMKNYYTCKQSKHGMEFCTGHRINGGVMEELVLETLQRVSACATTNEKEFTRQINEMYSTQQADTVKAGRKKLKSNQSRHTERDKLIQRIYGEIEFSLPVELSIEQNIILAHEYIKKHFVDKSMIADVSIHDKGDGNPHCHVMLIMRPFELDGTWGAKSRKEYILDEYGERIKLPNHKGSSPSKNV